MVVAATYPPEDHLLRDLGLAVEHRPDGSGSVWLPVTPELRAVGGVVVPGAVATIVDVVGGGLAAATVRPDWIATADLTFHLVRPPRGDEVEARARVLRRGRSTVVLDVELHDDGRPAGVATMSFGVLPRRADTPVLDDVPDDVPRRPIVEPARGFGAPYRDALGIVVRDGDAGVVELALRDYLRNSFGALQGGVIASLVDAAAEEALRAACGARVTTVDLQLTYLAQGKVGPFHTRTRVLASTPTWGLAHVEVVDAGRDDRLMSSARVVAALALTRR